MRTVGRCVALILLLLSEAASAAILRVPEQFSTIQLALNNLSDTGDTVLVAVGVYHETLTAPALAFVLRGDVNLDSLDHARPVLDPSPLPRSDTLTCLTLPPGSAACIEEFIFRNGPEMQRGNPPLRPGGIANSANQLGVTNCRFDTVYYGIDGGSLIILTSSRFIDGVSRCVRASPLGSLQATDCLFTGVGYALVTCSDQSSFIRCEFRGNTEGHLLIASGDSVLMIDNIFGPAASPIWPMIDLYAFAGCRVESNLFTNCQLFSSMLAVNADCPAADPLPVVIRDNFFTGLTGGPAIIMACVENQRGYLGRIEDNTFVNMQSSNDAANGITLLGSADLTTNRFAQMNPASVPDIHATRTYPGLGDTANFRGNLFESEGLDVDEAEYSYADARWNWWGDPTGPYHPVLNPSGQGGIVGSGVLFDPWYPDTSFLEAVSGISAPLPESFTLSAYPNPFNSTITLTLIPSQVAIIKVELFDLLGRRVQEIWSGPLAYEKRISFDGSHLSSGIYFVRVWQPIGNRPLALTKLVLLK